MLAERSPGLSTSVVCGGSGSEGASAQGFPLHGHPGRREATRRPSQLESLRAAGRLTGRGGAAWLLRVLCVGFVWRFQCHPQGLGDTQG